MVRFHGMILENTRMHITCLMKFLNRVWFLGRACSHVMSTWGNINFGLSLFPGLCQSWAHPSDFGFYVGGPGLVVYSEVTMALGFVVYSILCSMNASNCQRLTHVFPLSLAKELLRLQVLYIKNCGVESIVAMSEMVEEDPRFVFPQLTSLIFRRLGKLKSFYPGINTLAGPADISRSNITKYRDNLSNALPLFDEKVVMPNLETMKLSSMNTTKLWDDFAAPSCILNLTHLTVDGCGDLKYLFSSLVVMALVKLQYLKITDCQMMEDIFILDGKLGNFQSAMKPLTCEEVKFPNLETLVVSHMDNLKSVYHDEMSPNPFPKLIKMEISFCQKLLSVFPPNVLNNLCNLETLVVTDCATLEVVFEIPELNNEATSQGRLATLLKSLTLERLPMLQHIWSNDPHGSLQFQNLCIMNATFCQSLSHVFPLSVATELLQLQVLGIKNCGVETIVAMGEMVDGDLIFVFPKLTSLTFWYLEKLKSFYPGINSLACLSLKQLDVCHCHELEMFKSKSQSCQEVVPFHGHPLFSSVKGIPKIQELSLRSNDVTSICNGEYCDDDLYVVEALCLQCFHDELDKLPMSFIQRFTNLVKLEVACSCFREIFSSENDRTIMKLRTLFLHGLADLEYLCQENYEIQPILQNLETLEVQWCSRLKNIVPSSSSELFRNLVMLRIDNCSGLVNIITSSAARSFLKLRDLIIFNCEMIEEIVVSNDDSDGGEIAFMKLNRLTLDNLPRLTSFCKENFSFKFPLLESLYLRECPKMETFSHGILSTPKLRKVRVTGYEDGEWRWEGELNTTIRKIFGEKDFEATNPLPAT